MSVPNQPSDSQSNLRNQHNLALNNPAVVTQNVNNTGGQPNSTPNAQPNPAPSAQPYSTPNPQWHPLHNVAIIVQDLAASGMQAFAYPSHHRANIPHHDTHINEEGVHVNAEGLCVVSSLSFNEVPTAVQATLFPIGGNTVQF